MTDPTPAMTSFEQALKAGQLQPQRCELDHSLHVFVDEMHGVRRFAYVRLEGTNVTAFVNAVLVEPVEDVPLSSDARN